MSRSVFSSLAVAIICTAAAACSSPSDHVGKDGKAVGGQNSPNDLTPTPPNPNHDEGNPDPGDDQGEQPGPTCNMMPTPIPDGWKTYSTTYSGATFSVAAPSTGFTPESSSTGGLLQFFSETPGTVLGASVRTDLTTLDAAVGTWTAVLLGKSGHNCQIVQEATTYLCDDAVRLHATCANERTVEVMLVLHDGHPYFTSCELSATGDAATCAQFMSTLRFD